MKPAKNTSESSRFQIRHRLGAGGMGVVYEAYDTRREAVVALKVLRKVSPVAIYRFKQEFRAVADVRHRNLVTLYELVAELEQWFLTMELIDGNDFLSFVRAGPKTLDLVTEDPEELEQASAYASGNFPCKPRQARFDPSDHSVTESTAPTDTGVGAENTVTMLASLGASLTAVGGPTDPNDGPDRAAANAHTPAPARTGDPLKEPAQFQRLRAGLRQLVEGVMAVHAAGYLHGDLKPSNVMVAVDERVAVLDFGIVRELSTRGKGQHRAGTPAYAAPEIWGKAPVNEASDWYSVGVMLFEALTGRRPFAGRSEEIIAAKRTRAAPSSRTWAPDAPEELNELCVALLARDPAERPSGPEILLRLGVAVPTNSPQPSARQLRTDALLVGRERELAVLRDHFALTIDGEAQSAMVHGTSGMGKSALVEQLLREVSDQQAAVVLSGRCYQRESVPHKALDSAMDVLAGHLGRLPEQTVGELLPEGIGALARVFPVLARVRAVAAAPQHESVKGDAHELRRQACAALRELLVRLTSHGPLVLHIDDAQWGDLDSARFLTEVLRPPGSPPIFLILGYRTEEASASPFLQELGDALPGRFEFAVKPLGKQDARKLAKQLLKELAASPALESAIAREAQGSPFLIAELARYAASRESADLNVLSLRDLVRERVMELPEPAQRLLETLAVAGQPLPQQLAVQATGLGEQGYAAAQALCTTQLARTRGDQASERLETFHDRIRETVVAMLDPDRLRASHRALATAFELGGGDAETLAQHWDGAGEAERAGDYYAEAGKRAAESLAFDRAAALYERSLELVPREGAARAALLGALGDAQANGGRCSAAADTYRLAADQSEGNRALDYRSKVAGQLLRSGHIDGGLDALGGVLRAIHAPLPKTRVGLLGSILYERLRIRLRSMRAREVPDSENLTAEIRRLDLYFQATSALGFIDPLRSFALQCRYLRSALDIGDPSHVARALATESNFQSFAGPVARARCAQLASRARALADEHDDPMMQGFAYYSVALAHYQFGELEPAREGFARAAARCRQALGGWWETCVAEEGVLWCLYQLGEVGELSQRVHSLLREADARGDLYFATNLCLGRPPLAWLARNDLAGARDAEKEALASWTVRGYQRQHVNALLSHTNACLYSGDTEQAWKNLDSQWRALTRSTTVRIISMRTEVWHLRARAGLAAAINRDQPGELLGAIVQATKRVAREPTIVAQAMVLLQQAGIAYIQGDTADAARLLNDAIVACEGAHMSLYAASARRQLGRIVGGDTGRELIEAADDWMRGQQVVNPERLALVFAPGFCRT